MVATANNMRYGKANTAPVFIFGAGVDGLFAFPLGGAGVDGLDWSFDTSDMAGLAARTETESLAESEGDGSVIG